MARGIRLDINLRRRRLAAVVAGAESEAQGSRRRAKPSRHPLHRDVCGFQALPTDLHRNRLQRLYIFSTVTLCNGIICRYVYLNRLLWYAYEFRCSVCECSKRGTRRRPQTRVLS